MKLIWVSFSLQYSYDVLKKVQLLDATFIFYQTEMKNNLINPIQQTFSHSLGSFRRCKESVALKRSKGVSIQSYSAIFIPGWSYLHDLAEV